MIRKFARLVRRPVKPPLFGFRHFVLGRARVAFEVSEAPDSEPAPPNVSTMPSRFAAPLGRGRA